MLPLSAAVQPLPSAFATFAAQHQLRSPLTPPQNALTTLLQSPHFQNLIQSQVAALQSQQFAAAAAQMQMDGKSPRTVSTRHGKRGIFKQGPGQKMSFYQPGVTIKGGIHTVRGGRPLKENGMSQRGAAVS